MALITSQVARWAAKECEKQRSGEMSVAWLLDGWLYAHRLRNQPIMIGSILALGRIVEPRHNRDGLRRVGVRVGMDVKMHSDLVPAALNQLIAAQRDLDPVEWFRQYEEIHPFRDGNGRTGALLLNWLTHTLGEPTDAPDLWGHQRDVPPAAWTTTTTRRCRGARNGGCSSPPQFDLIYLANGNVVDRKPMCFEHGLAEVDGAHAAGSIAEARLVDAGSDR